MTRFADQVRDEINRPVPGALIYVYSPEGQLAVITDDLLAPMPNPLTTDAYGNFVFNTVDFGYFDVVFGGRVQWRERAAEADLSLRADLAAGGAGLGSELVGVKQAGVGAVTRTLASKMADFVFAEDFGAAGDGVADDTAELQAALNTGKIVLLRKGASYLISSGLTHVSGSGLVGNGGRAVVKAKTGAGGFNATSALAPRTGLDRNMLLCNGTDDIAVRDVHFTLDGAAEVVLHGIRLFGGMATEGYDIDCSFSGFDSGAMIAVGGVGAGRRRNIRVRSATDSGVASGLARFASGVQTTVVEIDNDKPTTTPSVGGNVRIDLIKNILHSGQALTDFGMETDGVNIVGQGADSTSNWNIDIGVVDGVGEPLDLQGFRNNVRIGFIRNAYNDAVKLIHGARDNSIDVGVIERSGRSAVYLSGSTAPTTTEHTSGNVITVGKVINPAAYGKGLTEAAGDATVVLIGGSGSTWKPKDNVVRIGAVLGDGVNLDTLVRDGGADNGNENLVLIGKASGYAVRSANAPAGNVRLRLEGRFYTELTMSAGQAINSATATKLAFDTVAVDLEGVAVTASNMLRFKTPGIYRIRAQVRADGWVAGASDRWQMELRQNVTAIAIASGRINFAPGKDEVFAIEKVVHVREQDIGTTAAEFTVYLTHDVGAARTVSNAATMTTLSATKVG